MKNKIEQMEDIYPLTIIKMRYGGAYVIFNMESDNELIHNIQLAEEPSYNLLDYLDKHLSPSDYGVGDTVWNAFENYKQRIYNYKI